MPFVKNILPGAKEVSILVENRHIPNFVTLTAPENPDAGQLFKWNNNFAWVYNGSVADSFKEKVKGCWWKCRRFHEMLSSLV